MTRELLKDKLTEKLIEGISSGRYPVGSLLPKELQLVESEGVSLSYSAGCTRKDRTPWTHPKDAACGNACGKPWESTDI